MATNTQPDDTSFNECPLHGDSPRLTCATCMGEWPNPSTPANEASDGVSLRERIRGTFERHTMPEAGDPELTMFDTDAIIDDLANLIHHHDQRIIAEAERRARFDELESLRRDTQNREAFDRCNPDDWEDAIYNRLAALTAQQDGQGEKK